MASFAPGPWTVKPYVDAIDILAPDGSRVASLCDRDVCSKGMPPENARLIAAAPTLLAVCKELLSRLEREGSGAELTWRAIDAARAAIAKAEGRQ